MVKPCEGFFPVIDFFRIIDICSKNGLCMILIQIASKIEVDKDAQCKMTQDFCSMSISVKSSE